MQAPRYPQTPGRAHFGGAKVKIMQGNRKTFKLTVDGHGETLHSSVKASRAKLNTYHSVNPGDGAKIEGVTS